MTPAITKPVALADQVLEALLTALRNGDIRPGTRLTEEGLAKRLGVSRTPIREALRQLARQGTLDVPPGGGYAVPSPSPQEIRQTVAVRLMLEPSAVRMAAEEYGAAELKAISDAIRRAEEAVPRVQPAAFVAALDECRDALFGRISNAMLSKLIGGFGGHLLFIRATTLKDRAQRALVVAQLTEIRDAIEAHDGARAERLWAEYIGQSADLVSRAAARNAAVEPTGPALRLAARARAAPKAHGGSTGRR